MKRFEYLASASESIRSRVGLMILGGFLAIGLLSTAAVAQEEVPSATADTETAADAPKDEVTGASDDASASVADEVDDPEPEPEREQPVDPLLSMDVEEIIVRGESAYGTAQDAPISAVGFDTEVILKEGIKDIRDLSNFTPSLEIKSAFAASNPTIFIRGVGLDDFNANAASAVAIYQDGIYMQSPAGQLFQFYDVEGVEVLRGPQGALYRNASAGAILVRSQKPTDEFEAYGIATYGSYNQIDLIGAVGGPIVPDYLSARLSASWGVRDGITENRCEKLAVAPIFDEDGNPELEGNGPHPERKPCQQVLNKKPNTVSVVEPGIAQWTNTVDAYGARGQLLFRPPTVDTEWLLNFHGGQNFGTAYQYQHRGVNFTGAQSRDPDAPIAQPANDPNATSASGYADLDGDPFKGDYNIDGPELLNLWGASLNGIWRLESGYEIQSITGYEWHDRFIHENSDANPKFDTENIYTDTAWQMSQELNVKGEWTPGPLGDGSWVVGAYYLQEDLETLGFFDSIDVTDSVQEYKQNVRNFAAYAQSTYKFQPGCIGVSCDFTLDLGMRYNVEYKEFDIQACQTSGGNCQDTLRGVEDELWSGLSGDLSLAWHFSEENNVYAKYSRGWKGGHFNGNAVSNAELITGVDPEIVDSVEIGLRSLWFDSQLMFNVTGFYYDYQDLQVFQLEQSLLGFAVPQLVNADDAVVYGVELDMAVTPIENLNFTYNFGWVESEYVDFKVGLPFQRSVVIPPQRRPTRINVDREFDYSGNPLIASPNFSMTGSVEYNYQMPWLLRGYGVGSLTPRFSFSWKDDMFYDAAKGQGALINFPEGTFGQKSFFVFNASLAWRTDDERLEILGWVRNFMDTHYRTQSFDLSRGLQIITDAYSDPRTLGITVSLSY